MKGMSFGKLKQKFSAVLLACAVFFLKIASVLLCTCYLLELTGPITPCFATFGFVLVHWGFDCSFKGFWDSALGMSVLLWLRGWAVCACSNRMCVTEREKEMELWRLVKPFPGELVTFFFKKFVLIEMKENFTPWGYYWSPIQLHSVFSN